MQKIKTKHRITPAQQRFIDLYDGDIQKAAKAAGLNYAYARQLMTMSRHAHVQIEIASREVTKSNKRIASREERQEFWTAVTRGEIKDSTVTGRDEDGNLIVVDIPVKMADRLKASEVLGKSCADFTDKLGIGGIGIDGAITAININLVRPKEKKDGS